MGNFFFDDHYYPIRNILIEGDFYTIIIADPCLLSRI